MRLAVGRPRAALFVAPHPDDEVIGAAGLLCRAVQAGAAVRVVIVTDGAASHKGSATWPRRRLIAQRRRESRRALRRIGVPASAVCFLSAPDGAASYALCRRLLAREVRRMRHLDLIVGPAADDAHADHRAVAEALVATPSPARLLGYRVWPPTRWQARRARTLPIVSSAKRSLVRVYRSQLGAIRDDPAGFAIARHELDAFVHPRETYAELR